MYTCMFDSDHKILFGPNTVHQCSIGNEIFMKWPVIIICHYHEEDWRHNYHDSFIDVESQLLYFVIFLDDELIKNGFPDGF